MRAIPRFPLCAFELASSSKNQRHCISSKSDEGLGASFYSFQPNIKNKKNSDLKKEKEKKQKRKRTLVNNPRMPSAFSPSPALNQYFALFVFKNLSCPSNLLASSIPTAAPQLSPAYFNTLALAVHNSGNVGVCASALSSTPSAFSTDGAGLPAGWA